MAASPYQGAVDQARGRKPIARIFGTDFTLHGTLTALDISELARAESLDTNSTEGQAFLAETFRAGFGDHLQEGRAEYGKFRRHMRELVMSGRAEDEVLIASLRAVVEAHATFPTKRPSPSPAPASPSTDGSRATGSPQAAPGFPEPSVPGEATVTSETSDPLAPLRDLPTVDEQLRSLRQAIIDGDQEHIDHLRQTLVEQDETTLPVHDPVPVPAGATVVNLGRRAS